MSNAIHLNYVSFRLCFVETLSLRAHFDCTKCDVTRTGIKKTAHTHKQMGDEKCLPLLLLLILTHKKKTLRETKSNQTKPKNVTQTIQLKKKNIHTDTKRVQNDGIFWRLSFWFSIFISEQCLIFLFVFYIASLAIIMMAKIRIRKYSRWFIPSTFFFFLSLSLSLSLCFCWLFACPCLFLFSLILSFAAVCRRCQCFCKMIVFDEKFSLITIYLCMRAILNHIQIHTLPSFQFDFAMQKWPKRNESVKK